MLGGADRKLICRFGLPGGIASEASRKEFVFTFGKTPFGWARVKLSVAHQSITATLTGYAYETIPGKPIIAGATKGPDDEQQEAAAHSLRELRDDRGAGQRQH